MLLKFKYYFIAAAVLILLAGVATIKIQADKIKKRNAEIARLAENNEQLMANNAQTTTLYLTEKEVTGRLKTERDSLAAAVKVKPNQITKIVYVDNITHDTIRVEVPVAIVGKSAWKISDSGECFKWAANALLKGDSLSVQRTLFEYNNRITQLFYRKRPHKFLFIRYGPWENFQQVSSECGSTTLKTFNFLR
jgi:hypothetical protein